MGVPGWLVSCGGVSSILIFFERGSTPPSGLGASDFESSLNIFTSSRDFISEASVTTCSFIGDSVTLAFSAAFAASWDFIFC